MYEIWVDGSVRGNPGLGGVGVVVKKDGHTITEVQRIIGDKVTNNESEYRAVIEGIKAVHALNRYFGTDEECVIYTDSKIIYNQLMSGWKINYEHLRALNEFIKNLMNECEFDIKLVEIRRDKNTEANDLAQSCTEKYKKEKARDGV